MRIIIISGIIGLTSLAGGFSWAEKNLGPIQVIDTNEKSTSTSIPIQPKARILETKNYTRITEKEIAPSPTFPLRNQVTQLPGILSSEVSNDSFVSLNYRGLGDPHESFHIQITQDEIPLAADLFGYPAVYSLPLPDQIESTEWIRSGSSLLVGPAPGGNLNFQTRQAPFGKGFESFTRANAGGFGAVQFHQRLGYSTESWGALGEYGFRKQSGFREANSDSHIQNYSARASVALSNDHTLRIRADHLISEFGEAGGVKNLDQDRNKTFLNYDRLWFDRTLFSIASEKEISKTESLHSHIYAAWSDRFSRRQDRLNSSTDVFGANPMGTTASLQRQKFFNLGAQTRYQNTHHTLGLSQKLSASLQGYSVNSPYTLESTNDFTQTQGTQKRIINRSTRALGLGVENQFILGDLRVTPGLRFDWIRNQIDETLNVGSTTPLRSDFRTQSVLLPGISLDYSLNSHQEIFLRYQQGYRPITYQDAMPLNTGDQVSGELLASRTHTLETGTRGAWTSNLTYQTSIFFLTYDNQLGRVGSVIQNVGDARHFGWEGETRYRLTSWFKMYFNAQYLNARFTKGPVGGKTPQYAPTWITRMGFQANPWKNGSFFLDGNTVSSHFADDSNRATWKVGGYTVWDLSFRQGLIENLDLTASVQNLFDRNYTSRIRSTGIDPAPPRTFFVGIQSRLP